MNQGVDGFETAITGFPSRGRERLGCRSVQRRLHPLMAMVSLAALDAKEGAARAGLENFGEVEDASNYFHAREKPVRFFLRKGGIWMKPDCPLHSPNGAFLELGHREKVLFTTMFGDAAAWLIYDAKAPKTRCKSPSMPRDVVGACRSDDRIEGRADMSIESSRQAVESVMQLFFVSLEFLRTSSLTSLGFFESSDFSMLIARPHCGTEGFEQRPFKKTRKRP